MKNMGYMRDGERACNKAKSLLAQSILKANKLLAQSIICGVDEVGRGPLAGPIVAAAVILGKAIDGVADSKTLTADKRGLLAAKIKQEAYCIAYGRAEVAEIEQLNIHHAGLLAMQRAINALAIQPEMVLVDGLFVPQLNIPCEAIVGGDKLIAAIGAASIIAKVLRDREMIALDPVYPGYGFATHKGYGTKQHMQALVNLGPCAIHRKNFTPVKTLTAS